MEEEQVVERVRELGLVDLKALRDGKGDLLTETAPRYVEIVKTARS